MKVAVLGANGQLGTDICAAFAADQHAVTALTHGEIEVSSLDSVKSVLEELRPELVINTAAFHNVDLCETDVLKAFTVNGIGARNVAQVADSVGARLIHISTDYVFDGAKPTAYTEDDAPRPLNVYGNTKLSGEYFVRGATARHFVVRVSGIYGHRPCRAKGGPNFVEMMLQRAAKGEQLRVVDDQRVTPTPTVEVARQLVVLSKTPDYGIYHATSEGSCSWYEFAQAIFELEGMQVKLSPAKSADFPAKAPRPRNSALENAALKARSLNVFSPWRKGLGNYLAHRAK